MKDTSEYQEKVILELVKRALKASNGKKSGKHYLICVSEDTASVTELVNGHPVPRGLEKFTNGRCP